jgi:F-type H+-transporting ATPase subunit b
MLIDWFTVGAQIVNFLILVWLLKHFLYKPILNAIDAREKRIAAELADADTKKAEAEKERTDFEDKNKAFDQQRSALLGKAADEAKAERERLIDQAKKDAESLRVTQADALRGDQVRLGSEITLLAEKRSLQSRERHSQTSPPSALKSGLGRYSHAACGNWIRRQKNY